MKQKPLFSRPLSLLLAALLALACFAALPAAADEADGYLYEIKTAEDGHRYAVVTGSTAALAGAVQLPAALGGAPVEEIGDYAFPNSGDVTEFTIPNPVRRIGDYAFSKCAAMARVTIPHSVTTIGEGAFANCSALTGVAIPDSVTTMGSRAFYFCTALADLTLSESLREIPDEAFYACYALTAVAIPHSVKEIGDQAFYDCDFLTAVTIPDSVEEIGGGAFFSCNDLADIRLPDHPMSIGSGAFENTKYANDPAHWEGDVLYCGNHILGTNAPIGFYSLRPGTLDIAACSFFFSKVSRLELPESLRIVGKQAFYHCESLKEVVLKSTDLTIGEEAFASCYALQNVTAEGANLSIGSWAFYNCDALQDLVLKNTNLTIGSRAFYDCNALQNAELKSTDLTIGASAFMGCEALQTLTFAEPTRETDDLQIGDEAFDNCDGLTELILPKYLHSVGRGAFQSCSHLRRVVVQSPQVTFGESAFSATYPQEVAYSADVVDLHLEVFQSDSVQSFSVAEENPVYKTEDGVLFSKDGGTLVCFPAGREGAYTLPETVTAIGEKAFQTYLLSDLYVPLTVTSVAPSAFAATSFIITYAGTKAQWEALGTGRDAICLGEGQPPTGSDPGSAVNPNPGPGSNPGPGPATDAGYGYVNDDDKINAADALYILQYAVGKRKLTEDKLAAADVSGDGKVNAGDALYILQYAVGKRTDFPAQK